MTSMLKVTLWSYNVYTNAFELPDLLLDMMAQRLARRAEDREVPVSSPARD